MYRRLSWSQGSVRLRVILGESGMHADNQALVWMFVIRFLIWHVAVGRVVRLVTETRAQYELTFYLPRLAKLVVDMLDVCWRLTKWGMFNPRFVVVRDPDFCASNRARLPLSLKLFGDGDDREFMEPFRELTVEEEEDDELEASVGGLPSLESNPALVTRQAQNPWWLKVVVDNAPEGVPYREPQGLDEVPAWVQGVADTKTLFDGEETDPGQYDLGRTSSGRNPRRPLHGS